MIVSRAHPKRGGLGDPETTDRRLTVAAEETMSPKPKTVYACHYCNENRSEGCKWEG